MSIKIGLLRERNSPPDKRVPFTPLQGEEIHQRFPGVIVVCERSSFRCYGDEEYVDHGGIVQPDLSDCDILMGIKEVPIQELIADKTYLFFSHTIKKQPYNKKLLQEVEAFNKTNAGKIPTITDKMPGK